jgi:AmmeMemoRadiSam system protein A
LALYEGAPAEAGAALLALARGAIEEKLLGKGKAVAAAPWLRRPGASFVTLLKKGALRGCIGSLEATKPLGEDVAENALGAAFRDPRFAALEADEWPDCEVDVSLLSTPRRLRFGGEAELLEQISPGLDGLILQADGRRATFLPQVWESVPEPRAFLRELMRKAGLSPDTALARCEMWRYRVMKFNAR